MTSISVKSDSLSVSVYLITRDQQIQNPGHWLELIMGASYLQGDMTKPPFPLLKGPSLDCQLQRERTDSRFQFLSGLSYPRDTMA